MTSISSVYIYKGDSQFRGVSADGALNLKHLCKKAFPQSIVDFVEGSQLYPECWTTQTLFILPGGQCRIWDEQISSDTTVKIKEFVQRGGKVLGFCSGAYFCCQESLYDNGDGTHFQQQRNLGFFPGKGMGPLDLSNQPISGTRLNARTAKVKWLKTQEEGFMVLNGGGCFIPSAETSMTINSYETLGTYVNQPVQSSNAIVKCRVGKGIAILSFVHPEYKSADYPLESLIQTYPEKAHQWNQIYEELEESKIFQTHVFENMIQTLGST